MDTVDPLRFLFAFIFVMGLIGVMAMVLKRYGKTEAGMALLGMKDSGGRLKVVEVRYIDSKRKLILVRRDNVEHLLLVSPDGQLVIESGIPASMMDASKASETHA